MDRLSERQRVQVHPPYGSISAGNPQGWGAGASFLCLLSLDKQGK